ncbi:unnamed protein product [Notodromas monacha]|uniref:Uncharacterized protein n=1 Tax=Notodromas monacha TaxID=399045 RepID=A0A7R9GI30_9CRUS|nr:unnamed protein product [Notodromas monacha]CAG0921990.1 unnamed protein product [Notodromas monacha]
MHPTSDASEKGEMHYPPLHPASIPHGESTNSTRSSEDTFGMETRQMFWNTLRRLHVDQKTEAVTYVTELHVEADEEGASANVDPEEEVDFKKRCSYDLSMLIGNALGMMTNSFKEQRAWIAGVNWPYIFLGSKGSAFPMHCEDMDLFSVNLHMGGYLKIWYSIQGKDIPKYENILKLMYANGACPMVGRHKLLLFDEAWLNFFGIVPCIAVQEPWDMIVTFPKGYHGVFNEGLNVNVAVNFAMDIWVDYAIRAKSCMCGFVESLRFSMEQYVRWQTPNLYKDWVNGTITCLPEEKDRSDLHKCKLQPQANVPTLTELLQTKIPHTEEEWIQSGSSMLEKDLFSLLLERILFLETQLLDLMLVTGKRLAVKNDSYLPLVKEEMEKRKKKKSRKTSKRKRPNGWTFSEDRQITKHVLEESKEDVRSASISLRGLKWKLNIPGRSEKDAKDRWRLLSKKASETRTLFEMASEVSRKLKDETFRSKLKQLEANFPPKPRTAKSLFIQARLRILERKNPGVRQDQAAQMKILGGKFKDITDEKKTKYSRLAMREKLSYEERKEEFLKGIAVPQRLMAEYHLLPLGSGVVILDNLLCYGDMKMSTKS